MVELLSAHFVFPFFNVNDSKVGGVHSAKTLPVVDVE